MQGSHRGALLAQLVTYIQLNFPELPFPEFSAKMDKFIVSSWTRNTPFYESFVHWRSIWECSCRGSDPLNFDTWYHRVRRPLSPLITAMLGRKYSISTIGYCHCCVGCTSFGI